MKTEYLVQRWKNQTDRKMVDLQQRHPARTLTGSSHREKPLLRLSKTDKMRIFDPETNQKARAYAMDYRKYHDIWIPDEQVATCFVNVKEELS